MESGERDMYRHFQDWCLRTYGDSGKTKTVTRKKYERIVQLLNGSESSSTDNAKFKFWVKSKGFQLGGPDDGGAKQVLYVPVKTTVSRGARLVPRVLGPARRAAPHRSLLRSTPAALPFLPSFLPSPAGRGPAWAIVPSPPL